ncbi:uncharacterized protein LOC144360104 [Saccoglossus kowalevskii]
MTFLNERLVYLVVLVIVSLVLVDGQVCPRGCSSCTGDVISSGWPRYKGDHAVCDKPMMGRITLPPQYKYVVVRDLSLHNAWKAMNRMPDVIELTIEDTKNNEFEKCCIIYV